MDTILYQCSASYTHIKHHVHASHNIRRDVIRGTLRIELRMCNVGHIRPGARARNGPDLERNGPRNRVTGSSLQIGYGMNQKL